MKYCLGILFADDSGSTDILNMKFRIVSKLRQKGIEYGYKVNDGVSSFYIELREIVKYPEILRYLCINNFTVFYCITEEEILDYSNGFANRKFFPVDVLLSGKGIGLFYCTGVYSTNMLVYYDIANKCLYTYEHKYYYSIVNNICGSSKEILDEFILYNKIKIIKNEP